MFTFKESRLVFEEKSPVERQTQLYTQAPVEKQSTLSVQQEKPVERQGQLLVEDPKKGTGALAKKERSELSKNTCSLDEGAIARTIFEVLSNNQDLKTELKQNGLPESLDIQDITGAFHYDLGKYEKDSGNTTDTEKKHMIVLTYIVNLIPTKKLGGINMTFVGGTDATRHVDRSRDNAWHDAKKDALKLFLSVASHDRVGPKSLVEKFTKPPYSDVIQEYLDSTDPNKYVKDHKDMFLPGGEIFDLALAVQRVRDVDKKFVKPKGLDVNPTLFLDLESASKGEIYRKASVKFECEDVVEPPKGGETPGDNDKPDPKDNDKPNPPDGNDNPPATHKIDEPLFPGVKDQDGLDEAARKKAADDMKEVNGGKGGTGETGGTDGKSDADGTSNGSGHEKKPDDDGQKNKTGVIPAPDHTGDDDNSDGVNGSDYFRTKKGNSTSKGAEGTSGLDALAADADAAASSDEGDEPKNGDKPKDNVASKELDKQKGGLTVKGNPKDAVFIDLMKQMDDQDLDFEGALNGETFSREAFASYVLDLCSKNGVDPNKIVIKEIPSLKEKGAEPEFGMNRFDDGKNNERTYTYHASPAFLKEVTDYVKSKK